jgi:uncharacterized protein YjbI with pentapeptide repeats
VRFVDLIVSSVVRAIALRARRGNNRWALGTTLPPGSGEDNMRRPLRQFRIAAVLCAAALLVVAVADARAQQPVNVRDLFDHPSIWDIRLGTSATALADEGFMSLACGTDGGPPARALGGFKDFANCPADANGLREVYFRYDDEAEYWARANDLPNFVSLYEGTTAYSHPIITSVLFDQGGVAVAVRLVSDPRTPTERRQNAYLLRNFLMARFGIEIAPHCVDLPRDDRETQIGRVFVKQRCERVADDRRFMLETHYYRRPGQTAFVPNTAQLTEGQFVSQTRLEIHLTAAGRAAAASSPAPAASATDPTATFGEREREFIAGRSKSCADCQLAGVVLKRRDLTGANLRGADLARANLHDTKLGGADLTQANLSEANLNKADLRRAKLADAKLDSTMLFETYADNASFERASMAGAMMGRARLTRATFAAAQMQGADLREIRALDAIFDGVNLSDGRLDGAQMRGAKLRRAELVRVLMSEAKLADADLADAVLASSDLYAADLTRANLARADLSDTRLAVAILTDANTEGANFAGAEMPDGRVHP